MSSYTVGVYMCLHNCNSVIFLVSNFRHVLNVVSFLLGDFRASEFYMPTFRNTLSVPSSQAGRCVWNELGWGHVWGIILEKVWLGNGLSH